MSLGRRKVRIDQPERWVFNRMATSYRARPPYPPALLDALAEHARSSTGVVVDVGAGIGHLALPLAARGLEVVAVEPAESMLAVLAEDARARGAKLRAVHGAAEALPLADGGAALAVVADALHFLDAERAGRELGRVLSPGGALAIVTVELARTPFMDALVHLMGEAAPRRPREIDSAQAQLAAMAGVRLTEVTRFDDEVPVDHATLGGILRSISYIGPAMNPARFAAFWARVQAISAAPVWARRLTLSVGRRRPT